MHIVFLSSAVDYLPYVNRLSRAIEAKGSKLSYIAASKSSDIWLGWHGITGPFLPELLHRERSEMPKMPSGFTEAEVQAIYCNSMPVLQRSFGFTEDMIRELTIAYLRMFVKLFSTMQPDTVVITNGFALHETAADAVARKHSIRTVFMQQGAFPGTLILDEKGMNTGGSFPDVPLVDDVDETRLHSFLRDYHDGWRPEGMRAPGHLERRATAFAYLGRLLTIGPTRLPEYRRRTLREAWHTLLPQLGIKPPSMSSRSMRSDLPEGYLFVPLEGLDDVEVSKDASLVGTMEEFVGVCAEALPTGYKIVVKPHPVDRWHPRVSAVRSRVQAAGGVFVEEGAIEPIITSAAAVVTAKSTVGLEALTYHKPVVVMGSAIYGHRGATFDVEDLSELPEKLEEAVTGEVDKQQIDRLLYSIIFKYLFHSDWRYPEYGSIDEVVDFLTQGA